MNRTPIEWCRTYAADGSHEEGFSVNPVRFRPRGSERLTAMCQKVSAGCANCYAEGITKRFWPKVVVESVPPEGTMYFAPFPGYTADGVSEHSGEFVLDQAMLLSVLKRKRPARVFWGDMTDLFGPWVKDEWLDQMFAVCALTPHLTHMFLTKRPERMLAYIAQKADEDMSRDGRQFCVEVAMEALLHRVIPCDFVKWPLPNVWLGVSVEDQKAADARIPLLLQTPAAKRFISAEPLLGPVDIDRWFIEPSLQCAGFVKSSRYEDGYCEMCAGHIGDPVHHSPSGLIDWVICGGESGKGKDIRPMHPDWARGLRDQCVAAWVPFFFKQWGAWMHGSDFRETARIVLNDGRILDCDPGDLPQEDRNRWQEFNATMMAPVGKKAAGDLLDGKQWHEFPEVPTV